MNARCPPPLPAEDAAVSSNTTLKRDRSPGHTEECPPCAPTTSNGGAGAGVAAAGGGKRTFDADGYRMEREWDPEPCGCGWHVLCNPERIGMLRDEERREAYRLAVARLLRSLPSAVAVAGDSTTVLDVGDGAACAFLAAGEGAGAAVSYEPAEWSHLLVGQVYICVVNKRVTSVLLVFYRILLVFALSLSFLLCFCRGGVWLLRRAEQVVDCRRSRRGLVSESRLAKRIFGRPGGWCSLTFNTIMVPQQKYQL